MQAGQISPHMIEIKKKGMIIKESLAVCGEEHSVSKGTDKHNLVRAVVFRPPY